MNAESRFNLLNPRVITAAGHAAFASICLLRPNLDSLLRAYEPFGNITAWGVGTGFLALILLLSPRASLLLMVAQLLSAVVMFTIGGLLTLGAGLLPTAATIVVLGLVSLLLFARTFGHWCETQDWYWDLRARPPEWVKRSRWYKALMRRYGVDRG